MSTHLYFCGNADCLGEFEEFHSNSIKLETCPHCQEAGRGEQPIKRLICGTNRGKVELTGKEYTDQIKADGEKMRRTIYSSEKALSNIVGETRYEQNERARNKRG